MKSRKAIATILTVAALTGMTLSGCGNKVDETATFATLDETTIPMGVANFYVKYQQAMYDSYYMSYFGDNMWSQDVYGNGNTMEEDVKNNAEETIEKMYLLQAHMDDYGISLTDDDETAIKKAVDQFLADNSKEAIDQIGADDRANVETVLRLMTIQSKMHDRIIEDADDEVTDEEAAQRTISYVKIDTKGYYDSDSKYVEYTDEEAAAKKEEAAAIAASADFDTAVTDEGYTASTASYGSADDEDASLDKEVLEAADKLKEGEVSGVVETDSACYVVRLDSEYDEEATANKKAELQKQKQEDYYDDIVSGWKDDAKWTLNTSEWEKVNFDDHFTKKADDTEAADNSVSDTESVTGSTETATEAE